MEKWVSISERLPEPGVYILTTWVDPKYPDQLEIDIDYRYNEYQRTLNHGREWWMQECDCQWADPDRHKILAWMPLPEPFKEV